MVAEIRWSDGAEGTGYESLDPASSGETGRLGWPREKESSCQPRCRAGGPRLLQARPPLLSCLSSLALVPGMPTSVMIVTGSTTPAEYVLKPILVTLGRALHENQSGAPTPPDSA